MAGIFHGKKERAFFTPVIEDTKNLLVPMICICEVFKKIYQEQGQGAAEIRIANLYKSQVLDLTAPIALSAAKISAETKLPMADSIILATSRDYGASLWTQDEHCKDIPGVKYILK